MAHYVSFKQVPHRAQNKKRHSINGKIRMLIVFVMTALFLIVAFATQLTVRRISFTEEKQAIQELTRSKAQEIGEWLAGTNNMLKAYAETAELKSNDWDIIQPLLTKAYDRIADSRYLFLAYVQASGKGWTSKNAWLDARPLPYYKPIILENKPSFTTNPFVGATTNKALIIVGQGVSHSGTKNQGIMIAGITGSSISGIAEKINIGGEGFGVIVDNKGIFVAYPDVEKVMKLNIRELDTQGYTGMTEISEEMNAGIENMREYTRDGKKYFISYTPIPNSPDWILGIMIPASYFNRLSLKIFKIIVPIVIVVFLISIIVSFKVTDSISKPLRHTANVLRDIAHGEGDLTVRLPVKGNDEITDLANYFNETIEKIGTSVKGIGKNTQVMKAIGNELSTNMSETASAVHEISANIDGVKQQTLTQASSVTETAATVEQIIRTIKNLNGSIETQAGSVAQSSSSIEEMVANIASITQTLDKTDDSIQALATATADGKETLVASNSVTQRIAEESGSLLEASSVIQHIASQTNLLAMNAAIEAAHAGEAGKGFAVVADEIRKLAEDSAAQGRSITATLKTLSGEIASLSTSSKTVEEKFNAIFTLSGQVKAMSAALMQAMREQENGSREVLAAIKNINAVTDEVQGGSEEMLRGGEQVAEEMRKLDDLTRVITDSMNEMASGAVQISNAVQDVNEIAYKNKQSIDNLAAEVGKFKV